MAMNGPMPKQMENDEEEEEEEEKIMKEMIESLDKEKKNLEKCLEIIKRELHERGEVCEKLPKWSKKVYEWNQDLQKEFRHTCTVARELRKTATMYQKRITTNPNKKNRNQLIKFAKKSLRQMENVENNWNHLMSAQIKLREEWTHVIRSDITKKLQRRSWTGFFRKVKKFVCWIGLTSYKFTKCMLLTQENDWNEIQSNWPSWKRVKSNFFTCSELAEEEVYLCEMILKKNKVQENVIFKLDVNKTKGFTPSMLHALGELSHSDIGEPMPQSELLEFINEIISSCTQLEKICKHCWLAKD